MKKIIPFLGILLVGISVGATAGTKITAELVDMKFNVSGGTTKQQVISYKGTTYVPIRKVAELLSTDVEYRKNTIFLGDLTQSYKDIPTEEDLKYMKDVAGQEYIQNFNKNLAPDAEVKFEE